MNNNGAGYGNVAGPVGTPPYAGTNPPNMHSPNESQTWFNDLFGLGSSSARGQNEINRDYQTEMANTAWQRGRKDMEAAGINPMSAFANASASTPSGASGAGGQGGGSMVGLLGTILTTVARLFNKPKPGPTGPIESSGWTRKSSDGGLNWYKKQGR